jgi:hypothetical protein
MDWYVIEAFAADLFLQMVRRWSFPLRALLVCNLMRCADCGKIIDNSLGFRGQRLRQKWSDPRARTQIDKLN